MLQQRKKLEMRVEKDTRASSRCAAFVLRTHVCVCVCGVPVCVYLDPRGRKCRKIVWSRGRDATRWQKVFPLQSRVASNHPLICAAIFIFTTARGRPAVSKQSNGKRRPVIYYTRLRRPLQFLLRLC